MLLTSLIIFLLRVFAICLSCVGVNVERKPKHHIWEKQQKCCILQCFAIKKKKIS